LITDVDKPRFSKWFSVMLVLLHIYWPPLTNMPVSFCVYSVKVAVNKDHLFNRSRYVLYRIVRPLYNSMDAVQLIERAC